jgi:hypothetical protein
MLAVFSSLEGMANSGYALTPFRESEAFQRYLRGPRSELAKLLFLINRFRDTEYKVIFNGNTYDANTAVKYARDFIYKRYRNEPAGRWVKIHAYRSDPGGKIIYLKDPEGAMRPVRDALLEELDALNHSVL